MKRKKLNGWIKVLIEAMICFPIIVLGIIACVFITAFLGLARVGMDNTYAQVLKDINISLQINNVFTISFLLLFIVCVIFIVIAIKEIAEKVKGAIPLLVFSILFFIIPIVPFVNCVVGIVENKKFSAYIEENYTKDYFNNITKDMTEEELDAFIENLEKQALNDN